jgi:hypothetical protein
MMARKNTMTQLRQSQNLLLLLLRALKLWIGRRVHLRTDRDCGLVHNGESFVPFRKIVVDAERGRDVQAGATFRVRFSFKNLSPAANRRLSLIPIPFIVAQPGFRSKTWLLGEQTGDFIGLYEFDSVEDAEAYWDSLPLRMMRGRAAPGSLEHEVFFKQGTAPNNAQLNN